MKVFLAYVLAFWAAFGFVFLKAFQQRNVAFGKYAWVLPISLAMASAEVYVVALIARTGYDGPAILSIGLGSGCGALAGMWVHEKWIM